jgi:hypothetical protein
LASEERRSSELEELLKKNGFNGVIAFSTEPRDKELIAEIYKSSKC